MPNDHADLLRHAADKLEQAADGAYRAPWRPDDCHVWTESHPRSDDEGPTIYVSGGVYRNQRVTAKYIALVDPTFGKTLAAWLRNVADTHDDTPCPAHTAAVAVARDLLRETDDGN